MFGFSLAGRRGVDLWPETIQIPPVVRIRLEMMPDPTAPAGNIFMFENDDKSVEIDMKALLREASPDELSKLEATLKDMAYGLHIGRIAQWANGQREAIERAGVVAIHHKRIEDNWLVMDYFSHHGVSRLDVVIKVKAWAEVLPQAIAKALDRPCMYIFHSYQEILITTMKSLENGAPKKLAKVVQKRGGWGGKINVTQLPLSNSNSAALAGIYWERNGRMWRSANGMTLMGFGKRGQWRKGGKHNEHTDDDNQGIMVASGDKVYTIKGSATFDSYEMKFDYSSNDSEDTAVMVTSSGELIYAASVRAETATGSNCVIGTLSNEKNNELQNKKEEHTRSEGDDTYSVLCYSYTWDDGFDIDIKEYKSHYNRETYKTKGEGKGTVTADGVKISWSSPRVEVSRSTMRMTLNVTQPEDGDRIVSGNMSYGDISVSLEDGTDTSISQLFWPPSLQGRLWLAKDDEDFDTDYGQTKDLTPWLHVANERQLVQAVIMDGERKAKYEGPASGFLNDLPPRGLDSVDGVLFDVPLSRSIRMDP